MGRGLQIGRPGALIENGLQPNCPRGKFQPVLPLRSPISSVPVTMTWSHFPREMRTLMVACRMSNNPLMALVPANISPYPRMFPSSAAHGYRRSAPPSALLHTSLWCISLHLSIPLNGASYFHCHRHQASPPLLTTTHQAA